MTKAHSSVDKKIAGAVHKKAIVICAIALSSRERSRLLGNDDQNRALVCGSPIFEDAWSGS
jgi:hypothetical protein